MRVHVIGAAGFVGSAFVRHFESTGCTVLAVTRDNYQRSIGSESDVLIDAAGNSRKFWAEEKPLEEFEASVAHRLRTLRDFKTQMHVHVSSVDVYDDLTSPGTTGEEEARVGQGSHYGFHKRLAEQLVERHAPRWLILRLAGMVGPGLKKNPVFDILKGAPLRIHPDSRYQFMPTDVVAQMTAALVMQGVERTVLNVCGAGLVSPREIAALAGRELNLTELPPTAQPRIVDVDIRRMEQRFPVPRTQDTVVRFIDHFRGSP